VQVDVDRRLDDLLQKTLGPLLPEPIAREITT